MIAKRFSLITFFLLCGGMAFGQSDCETYHWPEVISPCPEVQIKQKHDHTPKAQYRHNGWDTVIDCNTPGEGIILSCMPYIPVQYFNGTYVVEQIPYNPPDTTFYLNYNAVIDGSNPYKKKLAIQNDDDWAPSYINIAFPFYFFGIRKNKFLLGDNGIVTFATPAGYTGGLDCPYATTTALPWTSTSSVPHSAGSSYDDILMRDAIYGVYEDTYTGSNGSYMSGNQGIYYGVLDEFPCRKIIASWNQIPVFSDQTKRQTYQIVCYEGSNIIEVHIKQRKCCSSTNSGHGLIGIQNATGQPQVKSYNDQDPNFFVVNGSPAAFWPTGYNVFTSALDTIAFRFTPQGLTDKGSFWYRIFDDGRDSIRLPEYDPVYNPEAVNDTNGYSIPMDPYSDCPTLTKAIVKPSTPSKYVYCLRFMNANGDWYRLNDTITIGIDTVNDLSLVKNDSDGDPRVYNICERSTAAMSLNMTAMQDTSSIEWHIYRQRNGEQVELDNPRSLLNFGTISTVGDVKTLPITLNTSTLPSSGTRNRIDSLYIRSIVDFTSGCHNNDLILIRIYPNFDTIVEDGICQGETYTWNPSDAFGHSYSYTYTEPTDPSTTFVTLQSTPGCDSTVHLALTVSDVSHTIDYVDDCQAIVWLDGNTYEQDNNTATIVLKNRYDCDSVVQLNFTLHPLTARLRSNVEQFTLDNLDAVLTDISINGNGRVWKLPAMADQTTPTAYYSIPVEMDGAEILLIESSEYGCIDTASIYIPLNKENFWLPNVFTPDNPNGNNLFGSVSTKTLYEEMLIYNRRGELVFRCETPDCTWDGRDLNGNPCVQDAYVYIIRYTNEFNPKETKVIKGTVTLLR